MVISLLRTISMDPTFPQTTRISESDSVWFFHTGSKVHSLKKFRLHPCFRNDAGSPECCYKLTLLWFATQAMITVVAAPTNLSFFFCSKSSFLPLSATHNSSSKCSNTVFSHSRSVSWQLNWKRTTQNTLDLERRRSCGDSGGVAHIPPAKGPSAISMPPPHFSFSALSTEIS